VHGFSELSGTGLLVRGKSFLLDKKKVEVRCHICTGTGLAPAASAPGLGSPRYICTGTGLNASTSVPGLGSTPPYLRRD
jgi:hypothetical protein